MNNFPTSFSKSDLKKHFSIEYENLVGSSADGNSLNTLAITFLRTWKITKKREGFFNNPNGQAWLEKELPVPNNAMPIRGSFGGRKPFPELSERGKRGRVLSLFTREPQLDELEFVYSRSSIKKRRLTMECTEEEQRKKDNDTLLLFLDANCGKTSYIAASARHGCPSYYQVQKAKKKLLYPANISYGECRVEVSLANLIAHSTSRILEFFCEEKCLLDLTVKEKKSLVLWCKVGGDGQGDHSEYNQKNCANASGGSIYCISYVPLQLRANERLIWKNMHPNNPLICQPLLFTFAKETDELIQCEERKLREQIENLPDISISVGNEEFFLKGSTVKVYSTMWDGKSCTSIAKTFLGNGKKLASNTCHICCATPTDMNKSEVWDRPIIIPEMVDYSCTVLHMWIRAMEYVFNLATKLPQENRNKPLTSPECQLTKLEMKAKFWNKLSLRLFVVKHGHGSTNNETQPGAFSKKILS